MGAVSHRAKSLVNRFGGYGRVHNVESKSESTKKLNCLSV